MAAWGLSSSISKDTEIVDIDLKWGKENKIKNAQHNRESIDYLVVQGDKNNGTDYIDSKGTSQSLSKSAHHSKQIFTNPRSSNGIGGVNFISFYTDDDIARNDKKGRIIKKDNSNKNSLTYPKRILPSDSNTDKHSEVEEHSNPNKNAPTHN